MNKNEKRIILVFALVLLYIVPIVVLYRNYRRKPEVILVSRSYSISAVTPEGSSSQ